MSRELVTILLYMSTPMIGRCFDTQDLDVLRQRARVVIADAASGDDLLERWPRLARDAEVVVTGWHTPSITDAMLDEALHLHAIVHGAGSIRQLLPRTIFDRGIRVATANSALARGVAETMLGLSIIGLKGVLPAARHTASGGWKQGDFVVPGVNVREMFRSTVGVIGASQVGRHLIDLLRPFEVRVLVTDPYVDAAEARRLGVQVVPLDQLMRESDAVNLCAPSLPQTRHMMGAAQFAAMKDGAIFINGARGALVDESALVAELRRGRIWAFLDVTDPEPPAVNHPLRTLPNVVLLPHIAGAVSNGCKRLGQDAVRQLLEYLDGRPMHGEVSAERLAIMA